ncbi:MAG: VWA domain-containing protein [Bryobacterales bacterium]|nr:VWA domain-containing protein [Bryobacterales bacterium]
MLARCLVGLTAISLLIAQAPTTPPQDIPTLRTGTAEVIVPVTVTDEKGRFVSNLEVSDFKIFDEGREQKIVSFSRERNQPVVVGFLLDLSNASVTHWAKFQEAAMELVFGLLPGDRRFSGYLIAYATEAELLVNTTDDAESIADRIRKLKPGGGAALFDAVYMACTRRSLVEGEPVQPRRVIIVIGDGHDSASSKSLQEVLELAQRNLVTIYGMSTVAFGQYAEGDANLKRLCEETGGRVEYPLQQVYTDVSGYLSNPSDEGNYAYKVGTGLYAAALAKGIFNSVAALAGEVTTQYILLFRPDNAESRKTVHNLRVAVNLPPTVKIRHRQYYYPNNP